MIRNDLATRFGIPPATAFRWCGTGLILVEHDADGRAYIPETELRLVEVAVAMRRAGAKGPAIAAVLSRLRELPLGEREQAIAQMVLTRWGPLTWIPYSTADDVPQGAPAEVHLLADLLENR